MRAQGLRANVVLDLLATLLRDDAHGRMLEDVAAVPDDGSEGRKPVGIHDRLAERALHGIAHLEAARAADGVGRSGKGRGEDAGDDRQKFECSTHYPLLFF